MSAAVFHSQHTIEETMRNLQAPGLRLRSTLAFVVSVIAFVLFFDFGIFKINGHEGTGRKGEITGSVGTGCAAAADDKDSGQQALSSEKVHESVIAGSWYPGSASDLRRQIEGFLKKVPETDFPGQLTTLIAPHAGYMFSGQVAAYSYKLLEKHKFPTVVIIAPSHHARFSGVSVYDRGGFRTPLGVVPLDRELTTALEKRDNRIRYVPGVHDQEHALEIQLPFLQVVMPDFRLVPLVMGEQDIGACQWLAEAVADCIKGKPVLVVASSDLSHYHSYDRAKSLDQVVLDKVKAFDPEGLSSSLARGACEACGGGPIVTAMLIARRQGANTVRALDYANSGDVTGDRGRVVGYMAAALGMSSTEKAGSESGRSKVGVDLGLSLDEKALLHRIVKETIEARCRGAELPRFEAGAPHLREARGAFVTLQKKGELRGCIGHIIPNGPLADTVAEMSVAAAFQDPRFPPVQSSELKDIKIEISVLTPLEKIEKVEEIQVGVHGIYMRRGSHAGLLLPQVATEHGWDRTTFLEQTCVKANLPRSAWKDSRTEIYVFSADVF